MEFGITQESNLESSKFEAITTVSDTLEVYFKKRMYGSDIKIFIIHLICVKPEFDFFFKVRKPRYIKNKIETIDGLTVETKECFAYDIKLDWEIFANLSDDEARRMFIEEIINSLRNLDSLPKKVKDFDKDRFKEDLIFFFKERNLI